MDSHSAIACQMQVPEAGTPPQGGALPLPCLKSNNCNGERFELSRYERKVVYAIKLNVQHLLEQAGIDNCGFLTLTFGDHVTDWKEGQRRLHSFLTGWGSEHFLRYMCILEFMKNERIHYHLLSDLGHDIRTGFDFEAVRKGNYSSANNFLRHMWKELREVLPRYGFGRHELMPIKSNAETMGKYVAKYISKGIGNREFCKGARMVRYSKGWRPVSMQFAWNSEGARMWRKFVKDFAESCGFKSMSDFNINFGPRWAYALAQVFA